MLVPVPDNFVQVALVVLSVSVPAPLVVPTRSWFVAASVMAVTVPEVAGEVQSKLPVDEYFFTTVPVPT